MTPADELREAVARDLEKTSCIACTDHGMLALHADRIIRLVIQHCVWIARENESEGGEYGMACRHIAQRIEALAPKEPAP